MEKDCNVIDVCQALIREKSYSGQEEGVANVLMEIMELFQFDEIFRDRYGNVCGMMNGLQDGPTQVYDAHIDTVVVPDASKWSYDPFGAEIADGKIYGRGTSDMKGALAAMLVATREFAKQTKKNFKGKICVAGVVHEECFEGVAARELSQRLNPDFVVIGEASALNLKHGQRGRAEIVVETYGKPAHSANPEHGINAVYQMAEIINQIKNIPPEVDENLGKGILVLTDIISSPYPGASVVPDYCKTTWDRRLLVGETKESVLKPIQEVIDKLKEMYSDFDAKVRFATETVSCYTGEDIGDERFFPAWYYKEDEVFVKNTHKKLIEKQKNTGLACYDFCTNGSHYAGEKGIKTLGFGPSEEFLAHTIDEYIEVSQLEGAVEGYQIIMDALQSL